MRKILFITVLLISSLVLSQVGINTQNPQGMFHIDGKSTPTTTNPTTGTPTATQFSDDVVVKNTGNVGIGVTPNTNAMLDIASSNKGILIPRINLTSTILDLNGDGDNNIANQPQGLLVYNSGSTLAKGYYFWNGSEWRNVDNSTSVAPSITSLDCTSASISPSTYTAGTAYSGVMTINYNGGNGGTYNAGTPIGPINGLYFTLQSGKLLNGSGQLSFTVTGTPSLSSPTATNVPVNNSLVSFYTGSCTAQIGQGTKGFISQYAQVNFYEFSGVSCAGNPCATKPLATIEPGSIGISKVQRISSNTFRIDFTVPFPDNSYIISGALFEPAAFNGDAIMPYMFAGKYVVNGNVTLGNSIKNDNTAPYTYQTK